MIPKSQLERGCMYNGECRNASAAVWDGKQFVYTRYEWYGDVYNEYISHPDDDDVHDVFVPESEVLDFIYITKSALDTGRWYTGFGNTECAMWMGEYFMDSNDKVHVHVEDAGDYPFIPMKEY